MTENKGLSRREFLTATLGVVGGIAVGIPVAEFVRKDLEVRHALENHRLCKTFTDLEPSFSTYEMVEAKDRVQAILNGPEEEGLNFAIGEGENPSIRVIDKNGIGRHLYKDEYEGVLHSFLSDEDTEILLVKPPLDGKELMVNGEVVKTITINSDSWGGWNGNLYSIPHLLQEMLALEGYDVEVQDISVANTGPLHRKDAAERLINEGVDLGLVIETLEWTTDFLDMTAYKNKQIIRSDGEVHGISPETYALNQVKHQFVSYLERLNLIEKYGEDTEKPKLAYTLARHAQKTEIARVFSESAELVDGKYILVFLPNQNIQPRHFRYHKPQVQEILNGMKKRPEMAFSLHETSGGYDFTSHPNEELCFNIAQAFFERLTEGDLSENSKEQIRQNILARREMMNNKAYPAIREIIAQAA